VDPLHDLRMGAERVASEYAASEVDARMRLEALGPVELARRRAELERTIGEAGAPGPAAERLAALDQRIAAARTRLEAIAAAPANGPDPDARAQAERSLTQGRRQLSRLESERSELAEVAASQPAPAEGIAEARYGLRLVEEQMLRLRRRQVMTERLNPSPPILDTLGPYPKDPRLAAHWETGADLIHAFRLRYGITSLDGHPLGQTSGDVQRRRERQAAQQNLARLQRQLQHERIQAERAMEISK
jgi:hypothetical protein